MSKKQDKELIPKVSVNDDIFTLAKEAHKLAIGVKAVEKVQMIGPITSKERIEF